MINVLYIYGNEDLARDFLKKLRYDLKFLGINDIEVGLGNRLIKNKKFTMSAKSIYEPSVLIECERANYYITDVPFSRCKTVKELKKAFWHSHFLRTKFGADVRELSGKEELIKVLTED